MGIDPKPGELTLGRVMVDESRSEARTRICSNRLGWPEVRGNMPNEPGDSWFSPKYI